jgi:archaetidylinositol phosphate synthase
MDTFTFRPAERVHKSILASGERQVLIWIARRMPRRINSDHLTIAGLVGMIGAGFGYWLSFYWPGALVLAVIFLALNWFGDSLDGTLARVRNEQRPRYGFYVDHVVDAIGALFLIGGLGFSGYMSPSVAAGLIVAYFLLSIETYLATYCVGKFNLSFMKWGPTELRILLVIGTIVLFIKPVVTLFGSKFLLFDVGGVCGIVGLLVVFLASTIRNTAILYRDEKHKS